MASKMKSRSGCLTCLARKKKCDEQSPCCGDCARLGLACVRRVVKQGRVERAAISATNLRNRGPTLQLSISSGYPSFRSELEKSFVVTSASALELQVSCLADEGYKSVALLGRFSTQSRLVREALVAFQASLTKQSSSDHYKLVLNSYQGCVTRLRTDRPFDSSQNDDEKTDFTLIAICFLGLLEALGLGDPANSVAHFEQCRKLMLSRLANRTILRDPDQVKLYRMAAESIIYNLATLSPGTAAWMSTDDWGDSFSCLFPKDGPEGRTASPFLGGFQEFYHVMYQANMLLAKNRHVSMLGESAELDAGMASTLWNRLDSLEQKIPLLYPEHDEMNDSLPRARDESELRKYKILYRAKHTISVHALRIHLVKMARPSATSDDAAVRLYLSKAISILDQTEIFERWNPALRWPLTILACAATTEEEFAFIVARMEDMEGWVDPANGRRLQSAYSTLKRFRDKSWEGVPDGYRCLGQIVDPLDFLLEPRLLDISERRLDS